MIKVHQLTEMVLSLLNDKNFLMNDKNQLINQLHTVTLMSVHWADPNRKCGFSLMHSSFSFYSTSITRFNSTVMTPLLHSASMLLALSDSISHYDNSPTLNIAAHQPAIQPFQ
jgi:hypothetical protein